MKNKISVMTINFHATLRSVLLLLCLMVGVGEAWAQTTTSTWDGTVPSTANVSVAVCNGIGITGKGTQADPYVISTAQQFAYFASKMSGNTAWWKLKENIELDLNGENYVWTYGQSNATFKGHFDGNGSTISNMKFETNNTGKSWGLFPNLQGSSATDHAFVKKLTVKSCQISTPATGSYAGAAIGLLVGKANGNTDIEDITVEGGSITVDVETTGAHNVAGLVGQLATNENNVKNCTVSNVTVTSGTAAKKEYYVGGITGNAANYAVIVGNTVKNFTVTLNGSTSGNNIIGGLIGKVAGVNSTVSATRPMGQRTLIQHNTVEAPTITMNGSVVTNNFYLGGMIGWIGTHTNVFNNKVTSTTIALNNDINNTSYVGGAVGYQDGYTFVDGLAVSNGSITGPSSDKTVKNSVNFFVGGFLGYQLNSGTVAFQANKFKNVAVTGMTINLGHYVPASDAPIANHKFSVGGIAGSVNAPNMQTDGKWGGMPENLIFKGGKIYAPWASTSPIVANFNATATTHQNMTLDVVTTVDAIEKAKANTWYYNDYKLGLSSEFLSSTSVLAENASAVHLKFRKNYSKALEPIDGIQYLVIDNSTLTKNNRYQDSERDLKTVLWWTQQASMDKSKGTVAAVTCFTANEQPIYPQSGAASTAAGNLKDYPYYMYFFQGVGNAKYASNTDAAKIVAGIEANITNDVMPAVAMSSETNLNVTITNEGENRRGFDDRTLTVAVKQGATDATSNYTYQWYVDGKADGTGTTKTLTPHWKDGKGIIVNVLSGTTIVATASYGFGPGVLHTKASAEDPTAEQVRSTYSTRGTSGNPYVIDCESALRQLSYLSTVHTSMFWETLGKPASPYPTNQSQGHYNRAYYVLSNDIDLGGRDFTPISHVGYGSDGSFGTYNTNWIFQGVFDGQGHAIKNFKITWGVSQYVGNNSNLYYGLFGAVGDKTATRKWGDSGNSNTTIKNLIISGATLTHNTSETSFYYDQSISTNANNCFVGVLAGIVNSNTTIQNIEIRNSSITDAGSSNYSLATKGLYVGGAIGGMQHAYGTTNTATTSLEIQHIAAQVDITLTHPQIAESVEGQLGLFNIGGIIGRYSATNAKQAEAQASMPAYTIYSGTINAPKAWISPVLAALLYTSQKDIKFANYSKLWEGNNNSAATQITITNALYYNFYIDKTMVTESEPSNLCSRGFRTMSGHADGSESALSYSAQKYQGVNYNARYIDAEGASLAYLNENAFEDYHWVWENGFVHMSTEPYVEAIISRDNNKFTAGLVGGTPVNYRWQASFDGENWIEIPSVSTNIYDAPPSLKPKYIMAFVSDGTKEYRTLVEVVEANPNLIKPTISKNGNVFSFNQNSTAPEGQLTTTYEWYETKDTPFSPAVSNVDLTLTDEQIAAHEGVVWCKVVVTELGVTIYEDFLIAGAIVVFVNGNNYNKNGAQPGDDNNDGMTPQTPVKTINKANSLLKSAADGGTWDKNIIVVMGLLNPTSKNNDKDRYVFQSKGTNPATLTGKWNGVDYEGVIGLSQLDQINPATGKYDEHVVNKAYLPGEPGANCYVMGDTKFENLTFRGDNGGNNFIECHGRDVWFGKGLVMTNFNKLSENHGNFNEIIPEFTILLTATNLSKEDLDAHIFTREKPQEVTFQSGHYGRIMTGRYTQGFFSSDANTSNSILGSPEHPIWAIINIDIDNENPKTDGDGKTGSTTYTCDINALIAGLTDGSMYGDYEINFHGGSVAYIVGGNQGNPVTNGDAVYMPVGSTADYTKAWGQWPNSSFFGRTIINLDQDPSLNNNINIGNLYAGGLGRKLQGSEGTASVVDMYLYGRTEVNMKRGTITGNLYGGGAGGVVGLNPWDAHVPYATDADDDADNGVKDKVQYGKFGLATQDEGDPLASIKLHNRKDDGTYSVEYLNFANSSANLNIIGGTINGSVYGGGYGYISNMDKEVTMQGVGSVFGTTNLNISGGTITGNVYGGSQGHTKYYGAVNNYGQTITHIAETNGTVNVNISGTEEAYPTIRGNIYGAGQGIPSSDTEEYSRIATAGNTELGEEFGDKEKYKTDVNITIDLPESHPFENNIYGGGEMGAVDGNTNILIKRGTFGGDIFGGGKGEEGHPNKAKVTGSTNVKIGE